MTLCVSIYHVRNLRSEAPRPHCHRAMGPRPIPMLQAATPAPVPHGLCPSVDEVPLTSPIQTDRVLSTAQMAYVNGHYDCAIALARAAISGQPLRSYRIIGSAACNLGNLAVADDAYLHLDASGRQYQTYVCERRGIEFSHGHFTRAQ